MLMLPVVRGFLKIMRTTAFAVSIMVIIIASSLSAYLPGSKAYAAGFQCQIVSVNPQTATIGTDTSFAFTVTSTTDQIAWIRVISPSGNLVIDGASSTWLTNSTFNGSAATFTGGPINPNNPIEVDVSAQVGSFSPTSWIVQASNDPTGTGHVNCTGSAPVSSTATQAPVITSISVTTTSSSAIINWTTDTASDSKVNYGLTSSYDSTKYNATLTTSHSIVLSNLPAATTYHYQVVSTDSNGGSVSSSDGTFTTQAAPPVNNPTTPTKVIVPTTSTDTTPPSVSLTSSIPKIMTTIPKVTGTASDNIAVAKVEYSTDGGLNWLPVDAATGLGSKHVTFAFTPFNLQDGSYILVARATDNSGNSATTAGVSVVIDRLPPIVGGNIISLGPQLLAPDNQGVVTIPDGAQVTLSLSATGGPTSINVTAVAATKNQKTLANFALSQSNDSGLWTGVLEFTSPGDYQLVAHAVDGAGNATARAIANVSIARPGYVDSPNGPLSGVQVTAYYLDPDTNTWTAWDGRAYGQSNPAFTNKYGAFTLLLPAGTYYLQAITDGYPPLNTAGFTITKPTPMSTILHFKTQTFFGFIFTYWFNFSVESIASQQTSVAVSFPADSVEGTAFPSLALNDTTGHTQSTVDWLGKPTVITVFNTWAPTAVETVSVLDSVANNPRFNIKPIGMQEDAARLKAFSEIETTSTPILADPDGQLATLLNIGSAPVNYFVDSNGRIEKIVSGPLTSQQLLDELEKLP